MSQGLGQETNADERKITQVGRLLNGDGVVPSLLRVQHQQKGAEALLRVPGRQSRQEIEQGDLPILPVHQADLAGLDSDTSGGWQDSNHESQGNGDDGVGDSKDQHRQCRSGRIVGRESRTEHGSNTKNCVSMTTFRIDSRQDRLISGTQ